MVVLILPNSLAILAYVNEGNEELSVSQTFQMSFDFDLTAPFLPEFSTKDQSEHRHKIRPVQVRNQRLDSGLFTWPATDGQIWPARSGDVNKN